MDRTDVTSKALKQQKRDGPGTVEPETSGPGASVRGRRASVGGLFLKTARPPELVSGGRMWKGTPRGLFGLACSYWQDSQVPPLRIASIEQAARSASVCSFAGRRSREALSIELLLRVRK